MSGETDEPNTDEFERPTRRAARSRIRTLLARTLWSASLLLTVGVYGFRFLAVRNGSLFGTGPVALVDTICAGLLLVSVSGIYRYWRPRLEAAPARSWVDGISALSLVVGALAATLPLVNLLTPASPSEAAVAPCPGVRTWNTTFIAITSGGLGNNSRSGPARAFTANGRFPENCSIGFERYCLGEPVRDPSASTPQSTWVNNRWLVIAKSRQEPWATVAHVLSGERDERQMISESGLTPAKLDEGLQEDRSAVDCRQDAPEAAELSPLDVGIPVGSKQTLSARADHAPNIGFGVWTPPDQPFINRDEYKQIFNPNGTAADNPGETDAAGVKSVTWPYQKTESAELERGAFSGVVVVMAIPCLADNTPVSVGREALAVYQVFAPPAAGAAPPPPVLLSGAPIPFGLQRSLLSRAACQART